MSVLAAAVFPIAGFLLGGERVLLGGPGPCSQVWASVSLTLGFGVALVGGRVCARLGRSRRALAWLTVGTVSLGIVYAVAEFRLGCDIPVDRRCPIWFLGAVPGVDLIGILLGGWASSRESRAGPGEPSLLHAPESGPPEHPTP